MTFHVARRPEDGSIFAARQEPFTAMLGGETISTEEIGEGDPALLAYRFPERQLSVARTLAAREVDGAAEGARLRTITLGTGQAITYLLKEADARAYQEAGYPSSKLADYLFVAAERQATGQTGRQAADSILAAADAWRAKASEIDGARRKGKVRVAAAETVEDVETAKAEALDALATL